MWLFIDNVAPSWTVSQVSQVRGMFCVERERGYINGLTHFPQKCKVCQSMKKRDRLGITNLVIESFAMLSIFISESKLYLRYEYLFFFFFFLLCRPVVASGFYGESNYVFLDSTLA